MVPGPFDFYIKLQTISKELMVFKLVVITSTDLGKNEKTSRYCFKKRFYPSSHSRQNQHTDIPNKQTNKKKKKEKKPHIKKKKKISSLNKPRILAPMQQFQGGSPQIFQIPPFKAVLLSPYRISLLRVTPVHDTDLCGQTSRSFTSH